MPKVIHDISQLLKANEIKPSVQRIKIYQFLINNPIHPTVDTIYNALIKEIPTLSRTTVYNTLNMFVEKKIVTLVPVEDNEARYDATIDQHLHFKCLSCQSVFDVDLSPDFSFEELLPGFQIDEKQIYCKGICKNCLNINSNQGAKK